MLLDTGSTSCTNDGEYNAFWYICVCRSQQRQERRHEKKKKQERNKGQGQENKRRRTPGAFHHCLLFLARGPRTKRCAAKAAHARARHRSCAGMCRTCSCGEHKRRQFLLQWLFFLSIYLYISSRIAINSCSLNSKAHGNCCVICQTQSINCTNTGDR